MVNKIVGFKVFVLPLAAVFVVLMSVLYIKPAFDEMQTLKKAQADNQQQLNNLQKQNQKLAELKNQWDSMANDTSLAQAALPAKSDMEDYLAELNTRANRSGVLLGSVSSDEKSSVLESAACGSSVNPASAAAVGLSGGESSAGGATQGNMPVAGSSPAAAPQSCANAASVALSASGSWDQLINFFKYLEDTNRIANITSVAIGSQPNVSDQQSAGDLLNASISLSVFYKEKNEVGSSSVVSALASGQGFEESVIKRLNEVVFAPYVPPVVSASGERNIFK